MKTSFAAFFILIVSFSALAQGKMDKEAAEIEAEGKALYRSEMCSWNGTDILLEKLGERKKDIRGYFSYADGDSMRFIFMSRGEHPRVLASVAFDTTCKVSHAATYMTQREFTSFEKEMSGISIAVHEDIMQDTFYQQYKNCDLNVIPVIDGKSRKAYILTGPQDNGVVIFGNDYELTLDKNNKIKSRRRIHKNILIQKFDDQLTQVAGIHTHLPSTGDLITATDICTLMLYEKFAKFEQYIVTSEKYVSLWDCKKDQLVVLTKEAWERIYKDQEKRHTSGQESK